MMRLHLVDSCIMCCVHILFSKFKNSPFQKMNESKYDEKTHKETKPPLFTVFQMRDWKQHIEQWAIERERYLNQLSELFMEYLCSNFLFPVWEGKNKWFTIGRQLRQSDQKCIWGIKRKTNYGVTGMCGMKIHDCPFLT